MDRQIEAYLYSEYYSVVKRNELFKHALFLSNEASNKSYILDDTIYVKF
jgi:hypothetical protein